MNCCLCASGQSCPGPHSSHLMTACFINVLSNTKAAAKTILKPTLRETMALLYPTYCFVRNNIVLAVLLWYNSYMCDMYRDWKEIQIDALQPERKTLTVKSIVYNCILALGKHRPITYPLHRPITYPLATIAVPGSGRDHSLEAISVYLT